MERGLKAELLVIDPGAVNIFGFYLNHPGVFKGFLKDGLRFMKLD